MTSALAALSLCATGCDPVVNFCVKVLECPAGDPLAGARVLIPKYDADMRTGSDGVACHETIGELGERFEVTAEKSGYVKKTITTPDSPQDPGRFDTNLCLEPGAAQ
jgi:hypothetical protein